MSNSGRPGQQARNPRSGAAGSQSRISPEQYRGRALVLIRALSALVETPAVLTTRDPVAVLSPGLGGDWAWVGHAPGFREDVHLYRDRGLDLWALVPLRWVSRGRAARHGPPVFVSWEHATPQARHDMLVEAATAQWVSAGFDTLIEEAFARAQIATGAEERKRALGRVRAIIGIVDDPATEGQRLLAALRLPWPWAS